MLRCATILTAAALLLSGCSAYMQRPGSPLAQAAHEGNINEIRHLVAAGANPNAYDASSQTPLHWAARGGHPLGSHDCAGDTAERAAVVAALIDLGADVNAVDRRVAFPGGSSGWTPLHVALHHAQYKTAEELLRRGANSALRSGQGTTPMALAADEGAPREILALMAQQR